MDKIISFPHLGNYYIPIKYIISKTTKCKILIPPMNNQQTIKIGSNNSPNDICMPFKYNLGNYINALENGANILIQAGGGCRYGYFAELQEQILKEKGYKFTFINLIKNNHVSINKIYKLSKELNPKINYITFFYYILQGILIIIFMDKLDKILRKNIGYELEKGTYEKLEKEMFKEYQSEKLNIIKIIKIYIKYNKKYKKVELKDIPRTKILLIGELYSLIDHASSNNIERNLAKEGIEIKRYTDLTYLLITKKYHQQILKLQGRKYLKYKLGADGMESVVNSIKNCKKGIDGIVHIKSYSCTPEINAMPILSKISEDYHTPILFLSFDGENNIPNIDTKLEAFIDMIKQKK